MVNIKMGIMYGMLCCLFMTIIDPVSTQDSDKCLAISTQRTIESQEYKELQAMKNNQCKWSKGDPGSPASCKRPMKVKCACAKDLGCGEDVVRKICCTNAVCLNNATLNKAESKCSAQPKPIYKCECPKWYHGNRCQHIYVIRVCEYRVKVNNNYQSCDDENSVSRKCSHQVDGTAYECGPPIQNINGIGNMEECKPRGINTISKNAQNKNGEAERKNTTVAENPSHWIVVLVIAGTVLLIVGLLFYICHLKKERSRLQRRLQLTILSDEMNGVDGDMDKDEETDVDQTNTEGRPFLMRSESSPAP